jgi:hypothetical protein
MTRGRSLSLGLTAVLLSPLPASAQTWQTYRYPEVSVSFQAPSKPEAAIGTYKPKSGPVAPTIIYTAKLDNVVYSLTVADFGKTQIDPKTAIGDAEATIAATGKVTSAVDARIDQDYGRELTLAGSDGSRSAVAIFYADQHLYELVGQSLPPDAASGSGNIIRFQQSLQLGGPRGGGPPRDGFGRRGGRGGGLNPQALAACEGKKAGDAISLTTPQGDVQATCVLAARPDRPPPGSGFGGPPPPND